MLKALKTLLTAGVFIFAIASPIMATISPQPVSAAGCEDRLLGIPPWYRGLTNNTPPNCEIKNPTTTDETQNFVWHIVLNIVEMAIVIVAYIAVFFILYGGFLFITGGASPAQVEKGRKTITNAIIGLIIAMAAIAINNLIFSIIT